VKRSPSAGPQSPTSRDLSPERRAVLDFYLDAYARRGKCPTMSEAIRAFGTTRQAIYAQLKALVRDGYLSYKKPSIRAYTPTGKKPPK
jgi:hypothetical protein